MYSGSAAAGRDITFQDSLKMICLCLRHDGDLLMQIIAFTSWDEIVPFAESWDRLARGVPFRSWAWLSTWWRHFGSQSPGDPNARLMVLGALDPSGRLAGIAPWHLKRSAAKGWVLGWMGSGEVCSDYASILCMPDDADRVTEALAAYLTGSHCAPGARHCWDLVEVDGVDAGDATSTRLLRQLGERGCTQHENAPLQTWRLALPKTWEEFLSQVSKGHRKKLRRADRELFQTGRAVMRTVENCQQTRAGHGSAHRPAPEAAAVAGRARLLCFAAVHRISPRRGPAAADGRSIAVAAPGALDGQTVAVEYQMLSQGVTYIYQAGIDPLHMADEPGHLITAATVKRAIEQGGLAVDFLRGDEPYKAHFRAVARPLLAVRVVPNRTLSRLRNNLWLAGRGVKRWLNQNSRSNNSRPETEAETLVTNP